MRITKCAICDKAIAKTQNKIPYKGKYVHEDCFNIAIKAIKLDKDDQLDKASEKKKNRTKTKKPAAELKDAMSEKEYAQKREYYNYIRVWIGQQEIDAKVYSLTQKYIQQYNFQYDRMLYTLQYMREIKQLEDKQDDGCIGLLPYYYDEANRYYASVEEATKANVNININEMYKSKVVRSKPRRTTRKAIDINSF